MLNILGINITTDSKREILRQISSFLSPPSPSGRGVGGEGHYVVTPNPEILLAAREDEEFFYILNKADIAIPDGFGLVLAGMFMGMFIRRVAGIDLMHDICALAEEKNKSVFLLGGAGDTAQRAAKVLQQKYPRLKIAGAEAGLPAGEWEIKGGQWIKGEKENKNLELRIKKAKPDILFAAFGHVKQEKWIYHSLKELSSVKLAMGVGGSFDFIAGNIRRAPKIFRAAGMEWLWRLLQEPQQRLPRIYHALVQFPFVFFDWRFIKPLRYRPNVACLLYKKENGKIYVLLAERRDQIGHWQLPQGGTDGEDLATAGSRELREEIGTDKFRPVATFPNLHKYEFSDEQTSRGSPSRYIEGYRGQTQGLFVSEFTSSDSDITINYWDHRAWRWVELERTVDEVHEVRREATQKFIEKFNNITKEEL